MLLLSWRAKSCKQKKRKKKKTYEYGKQDKKGGILQVNELNEKSKYLNIQWMKGLLPWGGSGANTSVKGIWSMRSSTTSNVNK